MKTPNTTPTPPVTASTRPLRATLVAIGVVQATLGLLFLVAPSGTATMLGLSPAAPAWVDWLFAMMGARFLGFASVMVVAARNPLGHRPLIDTMIVIQVVDWVATVAALMQGHVTLAQVSTAPFLPIVFVAALLWWHPARLARRA